jgi:hypothetical protein
MASGTYIYARRLMLSGDIMLTSAVGAGTATLTFGDDEWNDVNNGTLTLISLDGTSRTYTIRNDAGASTNIMFNAGASADTAATNLKIAIEHADGHNGKLTVVRTGAKLDITQATAGVEGNTTITTAASFDSSTDVNIGAAFTGGFGSSNTGGTAHPKLYAMLYNTGSTIGTSNADGGTAGIGFNEAAIENMGDFGTLGEYLPGDSGSALTRQAFNWGFLMNETDGWLEMFVATTAMGSTRTSISFGSLASATLPVKGILIYQQNASSAVAGDDRPILAVDFPQTINGNGSEFKVQFSNNHSFYLFP